MDPFPRPLQVHAALFEPPAFQPSKLSVEYLPGADARGPSPPCTRRWVKFPSKALSCSACVVAKLVVIS